MWSRRYCGPAARDRGQQGNGPERGLPPRAQLGSLLFCRHIVFQFRKSDYFLNLSLNRENLDSVLLLFPPGQEELHADRYFKSIETYQIPASNC